MIDDCCSKDYGNHWRRWIVVIIGRREPWKSLKQEVLGDHWRSRIIVITER
jgi:hypothetical protein